MKSLLKNSISIVVGLVLVLQVVLFLGMDCAQMRSNPISEANSSHCSMPMEQNSSCCSSESSAPKSTEQSCQILCDCELKATKNDSVAISNPQKETLPKVVFSPLFEIEVLVEYKSVQMGQSDPPEKISSQPIYLQIETFRI